MAIELWHNFYDDDGGKQAIVLNHQASQVVIRKWAMLMKKGYATTSNESAARKLASRWRVVSPRLSADEPIALVIELRRRVVDELEMSGTRKGKEKGRGGHLAPYHITINDIGCRMIGERVHGMCSLGATGDCGVIMQQCMRLESCMAPSSDE